MEYPTLYRRFEENEHSRRTRDGYLRFVSQKKCTELEDPTRLDNSEGKGSCQTPHGKFIDMGDFSHVNESYLLCFSEDKNITEWGEHLIRLTNPDELKKRIKGCFPKGSVNVYFKKVEYTKQYDVEEEPDGLQWMKRRYWEKPPKHKDEKEWRFVLYFNHKYKFTNDYIEIYTDKLHDIIR